MFLGNIAVAVCNDVTDAATATAELGREGIEPECISLVAVDEKSAFGPVAYRVTGGHLEAAAPDGCYLYFANMAGFTVLVIPGEAVVLLAGPIGACVARTLQNKALFGALGPIASSLYALGLSREAACGYESAARQGCTLVVIHGRAREVARAMEVLRRGGQYASLRAGNLASTGDRGADH